MEYCSVDHAYDTLACIEDLTCFKIDGDKFFQIIEMSDGSIGVRSQWHYMRPSTIDKLIDGLNKYRETHSDEDILSFERGVILEEIQKLKNPNPKKNLPPNRSGYVYLIKGETGERYKIGRSKNPDSRFKQLKLSSSEELLLVHTIKTSNMVKLEEDLHKKYGSKKVHTEWFDLSKNDLSEIMEM
jgi:hypothetical protein